MVFGSTFCRYSKQVTLIAICFLWVPFSSAIEESFYTQAVDAIKESNTTQMYRLIDEYKDKITFVDLTYLEKITDNEIAYHQTITFPRGGDLIVQGGVFLVGLLLFTRTIIPAFLPWQTIESYLRALPMTVGGIHLYILFSQWRRGEMIWGTHKEQLRWHHQQRDKLQRIKRILASVED